MKGLRGVGIGEVEERKDGGLVIQRRQNINFEHWGKVRAETGLNSIEILNTDV